MSEAELNFRCFSVNLIEAKMAEELSRKRRTRGGHRSTATHIITSAIKVLATGDLSEIAKHAVKLNHQKASLQEKRTILRQLDMEILTLVDEAEIEAEIEQADLVEENIQLAIANIDHALSSNANTNVVVVNLPAQPNVPASTSTEESPVRASEGQNENGSSLPSALSQNENGSSPPSALSQNENGSSPPSASGQNENGSPPPSASGQNENDSSPPSASLADSSRLHREKHKSNYRS